MTSQITPNPMPEPFEDWYRFESTMSMRPQEKRVLWIGNSLSYQYRLHRIVARLIEDHAGGPPIGSRLVSRGGATLDWHRQQGHAEAAIGEGIWHVVTLQDQSRRPAEEPNESHADLVALGRQAQETGATVVLYNTWAYAGEPELLAPLQATYERAAVSLGCALAPVGQAFALSRLKHPEIGLTVADHLHPTSAGMFLSALVWAETLFGLPQQIPHRIEEACAILTDISSEEAGNLAAIAREACSVTASDHPLAV